jgi:hypothetical protein
MFVPERRPDFGQRIVSEDKQAESDALEELLRYPIAHMRFHVDQLSSRDRHSPFVDARCAVGDLRAAKL